MSRPKLVLAGAKRPKPHEVAPNRVPIYNHKGNLVGHVGKRATAAILPHFGIRNGGEMVKEGKIDNRPEWHGNAPPPKPKPKIAPPAAPAAAQPNIVIQGSTGKVKADGMDRGSAPSGASGESR
jgi:hypothetical protein